MARPSKLDENVIAALELAIRGAASYRDAALHAGISEPTFHAWCARGRHERRRIEQAETALAKLPARPRSKKARTELAAAKKACKPLADEQPFLEFLERVERSAATAGVRAAALISQQAADNWRTAVWLLERRERAAATDASETAPTPAAIVDVDASDPETSRLAHELLAREAGRVEREREARGEEKPRRSSVGRRRASRDS